MQALVEAPAEGAILIHALATHDFAPWQEQNPQHRGWLAASGFKAEPGSVAFLPGTPAAVLAIANDDGPAFAYAHLPTRLPEGTYAFAGAVPNPTEAALGWAMGAYSFDRYRKPKRAAARLAWPEGADRAEVERLASAIALARDLINTPAQDLGPPHLAQAASALARKHGAQCTVISGDDLLEQNYPTVHAVGRASERPPCLIDIRWGEANAPKVTLVGKGVCFDTGGLNLKPREGMLEMKKDMGGAAVVLALADALMGAGTPIRLRVLVPAVENSVAGNALRPLDVVRTRNGKTVEIGNTDAEGRLILCDALAEADSEKPELLVDCATLTGAARVALGPELQALFCDDDAVAHGLLAAGAEVGDPLWRMPIWRAYRKRIDGKTADLNNVAAGTHGGAIIAALYLSEFVARSTPWAHLDIFGSNAGSRPGRPEGGEATGMRALYHYIRRRYA